MRPRDLSKVLALCLALAVPLGGALAQSTASHQVSVSIPIVLHLRLDDGRAVADGAIDVSVLSRAGAATIEPGTTRVAVRANATWHLDARFRPSVGSEALPLTGRLGNGSWLDLRDGLRLVDGRATHGWARFEVAYDLVHVVSDEHYWGTIVYTLTHP